VLAEVFDVGWIALVAPSEAEGERLGGGGEPLGKEEEEGIDPETGGFISSAIRSRF
jgi:hypothetical protein